MTTRKDPDLELVQRCREVDSDEFEPAFEALYHRYKDRVYSIAFRITGTSTDAMDVVQEAFSLVFRNIGGFRGDSLFSTWLFRLVVNCAIDSTRQRRGVIQSRTSSLSLLPEGERQIEDAADGPAAHAETDELGAHVHRSLQRLSPKLRAILVLRYLEGLSYEDLAQALQVSMGTVKSRLARAHVAIQRVLDGTLEPFGYQPASDPPESDEASPGGRDLA